ncbi:MAG: cysteine synthase A [Candidatus Micropelagos sp.]|uniref:cysteine synthase n=1 Tax=PS1 clade bacterium TaxID=2175152 RepID=A0A368EKZ4_9PROT|nr:cysteine synthase A [Hyphomicrobiales bacterium]OUV49881.1 MAG: cysteine synthase A [Alphaproteobacteria bacterium TMED110]RCL85435.1 MAG: cysteine synthase A [PS1 clade bacterium]HCN31844.1 cysteine synthase A [Rhodobiaceae bacterium]|tara:strand:+ start:180 stop:1130 length:951 start_codon:yes stop_codon:yes gene_type:complete
MTFENRGKIYNNITETIGATPLVRLNRLPEQYGVSAEILLKLEFFNPMASVKDRIGVAMIEDLENRGLLTEKSVIVEPTSGNTGIALAFACAAKGYRLILCMPESMSIERRKMLLLLGAELELTPAELGMKGAIAKAEELITNLDNAVMPQQFDNPANPEIHRNTTAQEILADTDGKLDAIISGVGTAGTLTGIGSILKQHNPDIKIYAVEPEDSPILSGGDPGPHKIQGIGAGFKPGNLDESLIDGVVTIGNETAFETARRLAKTEGIPGGISSGAATAAALEIAAMPDMAGKRIVTIIPSFAERYLSTALFEGL